MHKQAEIVLIDFSVNIYTFKLVKSNTLIRWATDWRKKLHFLNQLELKFNTYIA